MPGVGNVSPDEGIGLVHEYNTSKVRRRVLFDLGRIAEYTKDASKDLIPSGITNCIHQGNVDSPNCSGTFFAKKPLRVSHNLKPLRYHPTAFIPNANTGAMLSCVTRAPGERCKSRTLPPRNPDEMHSILHTMESVLKVDKDTCKVHFWQLMIRNNLMVWVFMP
ncbi:hypothetical protein NA56DRAFT_709129 [Hyaloscypha hepaticicola]|uniref:Uncharacterized protein n=1 Tax=Hyaloscypha hepaticicola TaxID=2082293 RepID=A0A2J6PPU3_9HELO|nr:hypothetical protein NA56DRAFT_709129 [Hyaloscypha hepaticicola]